MYVNFYGRFYGKVDACANGVYQALSPPPLKGPGDEANISGDCKGWHNTSIAGITPYQYYVVRLKDSGTWHNSLLVLQYVCVDPLPRTLLYRA